VSKPPEDAILIVDDDPLVADSLEVSLGHHFPVVCALGGHEALEVLRRQPIAVALVDERMPVMTGVELLKIVNAEYPDVMRILITGYADLETLSRAVNDGHVYSYIRKPWEPTDVVDRVRLALDARRLVLENRRLYADLAVAHEQLKADYRALRWDMRRRYALEGFVCASPAMSDALDLALRVARSDSSVLLEGESGTGKEWVARAIHEASPRAAARFVAVNCGAIAETVLESELFGYRRGAFTGAITDRKGLFEEANGGTLFLDEIGDTSPGMQVKLLRVIQERRIRPVGSVEELPIDVRLISATHHDLEESIRKGSFRDDLYYRLSVFPIRLPPLRDRPEDVPLLAAKLLERACARLGKRIVGIRPEVLELLGRYPFPGNVRELENELERAAVLTERGGWIEPQHLSTHVREPVRAAKHKLTREVLESLGTTSLRDARRTFEREFLLHVLRHSGGKVSWAAQRLGLSRIGLHKKLRLLRGCERDASIGGDGERGPALA